MWSTNQTCWKCGCRENTPQLWSFSQKTKFLDTRWRLFTNFFDKKYNVTDPIAMLRSTWSTNPHFRGTYSYSSVEAKKNNISLDDIESPITPENLVMNVN